jgi:D-xylose 1-dehydrogenase (NADP+, D-xylono-1,5-lactone-forming)
MSTDTKLRWGIMGCARISRSGLIPGILGSRSGSLAALASRDQAVAQAWAHEFGIPRAYGSYQQLLNDPAIDAVYIPLPNELHKPWVIAAADAGKQVLCEKPLALDAKEARAMVDHCKHRGVILMEAFMWRHQERTRDVLERVVSGAIGELRLIRSSHSFPIDAGDWRLDPARGGGALWDVGCYGVSTARLFAGEEPRACRALAHFGETGVDLTLTALLEFSRGLIATIDCSFEQPRRGHYELVGTRGVIDVPHAYDPAPIRPSSATLRVISEGRESGTVEAEPTVLEYAAANQFGAMVDQFARSVAAGKLLAPAEDGLAQMIALDQVLNAAIASGASDMPF